MTRFQPAGSHTVTPRIIVADPKALITFLKAVFHAHGEYANERPAELKIGDSVIMISDGGGLRDVSTAFLYVYVEDTDATFARAMAADRGSKRMAFWLVIGLLGASAGKALYARLLGMRHIETVPVTA